MLDESEGGCDIGYHRQLSGGDSFYNLRSWIIFVHVHITYSREETVHCNVSHLSVYLCVSVCLAVTSDGAPSVVPRYPWQSDWCGGSLGNREAWLVRRNCGYEVKEEKKEWRLVHKLLCFLSLLAKTNMNKPAQLLLIEYTKAKHYIT